MSLEQSIADLKASIDNLTAAVEAGNEGRAAVLDAAKAASAKAAPAKKADKPAEAEKPAETAKTDGPSVDDLKAAVVGYTEGTEGAERDARKAKIAELFKRVGATNVGTVPEAKYGAVIKALNTLKAAGNVLADEADAGDEDDDLLGD